MTIASILKIALGCDSKSLKLDHGMKNNYFGSLSIRLLILKLSTSYRKLAKISQTWRIKNKSTGHVKIKVIFVP